MKGYVSSSLPEAKLKRNHRNHLERLEENGARTAERWTAHEDDNIHSWFCSQESRQREETYQQGNYTTTNQACGAMKRIKLVIIG